MVLLAQIRINEDMQNLAGKTTATSASAPESVDTEIAKGFGGNIVFVGYSAQLSGIIKDNPAGQPIRLLIFFVVKGVNHGRNALASPVIVGAL